MSVSGPSGFQPVSADIYARTNEEASRLLETLRNLANDPQRFDADVDATFARYGRWVRDWVRGYLADHPGVLDRVDNWKNDALKELADNVFTDGTVSADEVRALVKEASDFGRLSDAESALLTSLLNDRAAAFEPAARQALADFLGIENPLPVRPSDEPSETGGAAAASAPEPWMPAREVLAKHGLNTEGPKTESRYEGDKWGDVGYYPYDGSSGQYTSFAKFQGVFGHGAEDGHSWFENYADPPTGLSRGSMILSGDILESDFELTAGIDITGSRKISADAYKAVRESGGGKRASYALFDADGNALPFGPDDELVPMREENGQWQKAERGARGVTFMIRRPDGTIETDAVAKEFEETIGADEDVAFDFLDATGRRVAYNPDWGDKIAETFKDDDGAWHALTRTESGNYEHRVFNEDGTERSRESIDAASREALIEGKKTIYRVLGANGKLRGDGEVSGAFDMWWWGKCHNVAALSTSNIERPKQSFSVVSNLEEGDVLALRLGKDTLIRNDDGSYLRQVRDASGRLTDTQALSAEEARALEGFEGAEPVIIKKDGRLAEAEYETFTPEDVDALTSHIGNGATTYEGFEGERYYGAPDVVTLKDGSTLSAYITSARTASGQTIEIGKREGFEFRERDRSALRAPGLRSFSETDPRYRRRYARSEIDLEQLNSYRDDDITELTLVEPDGTERTVNADEVASLKWENRLDFSPDLLWKLHSSVTKERSSVTETYSGTQVWNYATRAVETEAIDPATLSEEQKRSAALPGVKAGTTGEAGKFYFRTEIETEGSTKELTYWVRFDENGEVADYAYLGDPDSVLRNVPDFTWTSHVKNPYEERWSGESQAPGISNEEIRRIYLASQGAFAKRMVGRFIAKRDLETATPVRPPETTTNTPG